MKIFVPCDAAAIAVGADAVAQTIETEIAARRLDAQVIRNGLRGMLWLEPLVEVETPKTDSAEASLACDRRTFGKPTVVNNVIFLATVPIILAKGAKFYQEFGVGKSRGTLTIQLAGNVKYGGLVEKAFGITLREAIYEYGGGTATGRPLRAV